MTKTIKVHELLKLIEEGKQPETIMYHGVRYTWSHLWKRYESCYDEPSVTCLGFSLAISRVTYEDSILDDAEKRYLRAVIRPWRDKVQGISKLSFNNKEFVGIMLQDESVSLPYFPAGSMYKGMEVMRTYTLEELEL